VWRVPLIRQLTLLAFGVSLTGGAVLGLLVVYAHSALGSGGDTWTLLLYLASGLGGLVATLLAPWLIRRIRLGRLVCSLLAANALSLVAFAVSPGIAPALTALAAYEFTYLAVVLTVVTVRQALTPDEFQGRVNVTGRMVAWAGQPIGAVAAGLLADQIPIRHVIGLFAAGIVASTIGAAFSSLRSSDTPAQLRSRSEPS
jgi:hypothetical protein